MILKGNKNRILVFMTLLAVLLIAAFVLWGVNPSNVNYFLSRRLPKALSIAFTAIAIAVSSTIFQTVSNNRILTPSVLGLDSLYMLVQTLIVFFLGSMNILIADKNVNFIITVLLMLFFSGLLYRFLFNKEKTDLMKLLLVGMIFGTLFQSLTSFMQMVMDPNEFQHVQDKMFASFNNVNTNILLISTIAVLVSVIYVYKRSKVLDVLSLGKEQATNLGINYTREIRKLLFIVSILVSVSTALVGPITFLGILVVNLARVMLNTYEHKFLFIGSGLLGVIALVGGQLLVERIFNFGTPISVLINFAGGLYFIYLLIKENVK
jgi:iron complex transport system permease protein